MRYKPLIFSASLILFGFLFGNIQNNKEKVQEIKPEEIRMSVSNQVRGSAFSLEKSIFDFYLEGRFPKKKFEKHFDTYFANLFPKNTGGYGSLLARAIPYMPLIRDLENQLKIIPEFHLLPGVESGYGRDILSDTGVEAIGQTSNIALDELIRVYSKDKERVENLFPFASLSQLKFDAKSVDEFLVETDFERLGYNYNKYADKLEKFAMINEAQIKRVILPRYLLFREIFPNGIDKNKILKDENENLKAAACYYLSNKLELGSLSIFPGDGIPYYLDYDINGSNIFTDMHYFASYNLGPEPIKKLAKLEGFKIQSSFWKLLIRNAPEVINRKFPQNSVKKALEAQSHYNAAVELFSFFEELSELGIRL